MGRSQLNVGWQVATVAAVKRETGDVKTFMLEPENGEMSFVAGQHIDVRLTAPDGYQAQRSYSIASAPERPECIDITIELLEDGEVSPYFHYVVEPGDQVEFRGPIGGPFTWRAREGARLLLIGGGSGVVPLMSMLRHRAASGKADGVPAVLLYSSRTDHHIIYRGELDDMDAADGNVRVLHTLTRHQPPGWAGRRRRVDIEMVRDALGMLDGMGGDNDSDSEVLCYVCGPSDFVENSGLFAVELGIAPENVRTERFGPTGT